MLDTNFRLPVFRFPGCSVVVIKSWIKFKFSNFRLDPLQSLLRAIYVRKIPITSQTQPTNFPRSDHNLFRAPGSNFEVQIFFFLRAQRAILNSKISKWWMSFVYGPREQYWIPKLSSDGDNLFLSAPGSNFKVQKFQVLIINFSESPRKQFSIPNPSDENYSIS